MNKGRLFAVAMQQNDGAHYYLLLMSVYDSIKWYFFPIGLSTGHTFHDMWWWQTYAERVCVNISIHQYTWTCICVDTRFGCSMWTLYLQTVIYKFGKRQNETPPIVATNEWWIQWKKKERQKMEKRLTEHWTRHYAMSISRTTSNHIHLHT